MLTDLNVYITYTILQASLGIWRRTVYHNITYITLHTSFIVHDESDATLHCIVF